MRPQLIVDLRERSFAAVVLREKGAVLPCSQQADVARRWFASEVLLAPGAERAGLDRELAAEDLALARPRNLFARLKPLGVLRPWDLAPGTEAVPLRHPLRVLSAPGALEQGGRGLRAACAALLDALLDPLFQFLESQGLPLAEMEGWAIVPAWTGGPAWRVLRRLFARRGIRSLRLLPRQVAAAMLAGEEALGGCLVVDAGGDDLHLHLVTLESDGPVRAYRMEGSRTVRGLGWSYWVQRLHAALVASGRLAGDAAGGGGTLMALDRALAGLAGGPYSTEVPADPPLRLGHGLLDELLAGRAGKEKEKQGEQRSARLNPASGTRVPARDDPQWHRDGYGAAGSHASSQDRHGEQRLGEERRGEERRGEESRGKSGLGEEMAEPSLGDEIAGEIAERLRPALRELGAERYPVVALGPAAALGPVESLLLRAVEGQAATQAAPVAALERCVRGAAGALSWLAADPRRGLEVGGAAALRLDTLDGGSRELLPATALPRRPGERCRIRRLFTLQGDTAVADSLAASLLWGCDSDPDANASACVLVLDPGLGDAPAPRTLEVEVTLTLAPGGRRLAGIARAAIGGASATRRFQLPDLAPAIHAGDLGALRAAVNAEAEIAPASHGLENNP
jgi:hypothetical protein